MSEVMGSFNAKQCKECGCKAALSWSREVGIIAIYSNLTCDQPSHVMTLVEWQQCNSDSDSEMTEIW